MKVRLIMVSSLDGCITRGDDPKVQRWTSAEDKLLFSSLRDHASLIVMGRKTFEAARANMELSPEHRRIVLTRNPIHYTQYAIPGQLEFTDESPVVLLQRLEKEGHTQLLLVGGGEVNAAFLQAGLIDEIHLTIEPRVFGKGKNLLADVLVDVQLRLLEMKKLNDQGTLHCVYQVLRK